MKSAYALIILALSTTLAFANPSNGIEVVGSGSVEIKPAIAELTFAVDATAEVAGDAITRFEQSRSRATEALNQLQIPNAEIIQQAFSIGVGNKAQNSRVHMGMHRGNRTTPTEVVLSQPVTIRISNVDKLERKELIERLTRIIDTARDLGLKLTNSSSSSSSHLPTTSTDYRTCSVHRTLEVWAVTSTSCERRRKPDKRHMHRRFNNKSCSSRWCGAACRRARPAVRNLPLLREGG